MEELLHTPSFITWQGGRWLFCCREPMIYLGAWSPEKFSRQADDGDGEALFYQIVEGAHSELWEAHVRGSPAFTFFAVSSALSTGDTGISLEISRVCVNLREKRYTISGIHDSPSSASIGQ